MKGVGMKLAGKLAIVTGSARGIGKAIAMGFASEGATVVVTDILVEQAHQVVDEIKSQGGTALAFKADVANRADVHNLVKSTLEDFNAIHILVNNAAIIRRAPLLQMTEEDWDVVLDVDLKGVFFCTQAVLGHMMEQRYGKIINISSLFGVGVPQEGTANYAAAKAGVVQLTKVTAVEAGPHGINVNCIAPGLIMTGMTYIGRSKEEVERTIEERAKRSALGRYGKPEDVVKLALFLASDDSNYITGQVICCNGGHHDRM
ncbi:SDR family NAD(P)-dependent oxidoreductase [Chloroflexota bacterium]